eukprot:11074314-Heterocapsa_arctica.AAC.1
MKVSPSSTDHDVPLGGVHLGPVQGLQTAKSRTHWRIYEQLRFLAFYSLDRSDSLRLQIKVPRVSELINCCE